MKFLSVGEMVIDFLPGDREGCYLRRAGGAPANVAIAVARQGCEAGFCGRLGNDDFGRFLLNTLRENKVTPLQERLTDEAVTTMTFVTLNARGERSFTFVRKPGADMLLNEEDLKHPYFHEADVIHAGSCSLSAGTAREATKYALREGHRQGKLVSFDVNYRELLWEKDRAAACKAVGEILPWVDILKISQEEWELIGGRKQVFQMMEKQGVTVVVETLGAAGARCFFAEKEILVPGIQTECVDATGAGDAFWGGFLSVLLKKEAVSAAELTEAVIREAAELGNLAGAFCVQQKGAIEALPYAAEIKRCGKELGQ